MTGLPMLQDYFFRKNIPGIQFPGSMAPDQFRQVISDGAFRVMPSPPPMIAVPKKEGE